MDEVKKRLDAQEEAIAFVVAENVEYRTRLELLERALFGRAGVQE